MSSELKLSDIADIMVSAIINLGIAGDDSTQISPWITRVAPFILGYAEDENTIQDVRRMAKALAGYYKLHDDLENLAVLVAICTEKLTESANDGGDDCHVTEKAIHIVGTIFLSKP